ncbi:MAG: hypothetical protein A3D93_02110 [Acidobacteria bacterium RIFCSPHIGHO2_12_FULL_67_30]|nr:MAG: hypothetical protein A3D93_02110 [Acidobacteria bacterium RIFCSPHIGHO2_12_FULL_67_30]
MATSFVKKTSAASGAITEFLGSAAVFASAVSDVVEEELLREVGGARVRFAHFKLLKLVAATGTHHLGDVAAFLGVSNAAASKTVDKLVRRKLLRRKEEEADRRAIELSLTDAGRRLLEAYEATRQRRLAAVFAHLAPAELAQTAEVLDRVSRELVAPAADGGQFCHRCGIYFREQCPLRAQGWACFYAPGRER